MTRTEKALKFLITRNGNYCSKCPAYKKCKVHENAGGYVWTEKDKVECYHEMSKWVKGKK